jgi:predicted  nucleic acid-binding Zn-ribbon protein
LHIVKFKGCKRCGGDLFLERDSEGFYISCLQCGAVYNRRDEEINKSVKYPIVEEVPGTTTMLSETD